MRRASRIDKNHTEIVDCFRRLGCSVLSLAAMGKGVPDLLVATQGITWLVEVKSGKGQENQLQTEWAENWKGVRALVRDTQGVETIVKTMRSLYAQAHPNASDGLQGDYLSASAALMPALIEPLPSASAADIEAASR